MEQLNHAIPADPRSARTRCPGCWKTHHPIKSMLAWMIGSAPLLGVGLASKTAH